MPLTPETHDLLLQLLEKSPRERIAVANALWDSIKVDDEYRGTPDEDAFYEDLMRRDAEMEAGEVVELTHEEVMADLRRELDYAGIPKESE
jgi:putative addiction module component (TIGR02574 family)